MKATTPVCQLAGTAFALLLACSSTPSTSKSGERLDGGSDGIGTGEPFREGDGGHADEPVASGGDGASVGFTTAACKADTCSAEAKICGWGSSDAKYLGCLSDCDTLGILNARCPEKAAALYACASLGAKVDCTTGKGTGCAAEEQQLAACLMGGDGGS
jgi:hypothetical protein